MALVVPFETVATFSDKKNNNCVVDIALHSLPREYSTNAACDTRKPTRVDKATITDPEDDLVVPDPVSERTRKKSGLLQLAAKSANWKGPLQTVLDTLKMAFQWGNNSRESNGPIRMDNGLWRKSGYNQLQKKPEGEDEEGNNNFWTQKQPEMRSSSRRRSQFTDSHLSSPISEMDQDSDDQSWDDEELTCNVCDRAFSSPYQLERHQQKKRHWGCNACDSLFGTLMLLEHHKEEYEHWSDDEYVSATDDDDLDFEEEEEGTFCGTKEVDQYLKGLRRTAQEQETGFNNNAININEDLERNLLLT